MGKKVYREHVQGDQIGGDKVGHDKITVGNISGGSTVQIGHGNKAAVQHGIALKNLSDVFKEAYSQIEAREEDPTVGKDEITDTVKRIENEVNKGQDAEPAKVERWLKTLANVAPDIFTIIGAALSNPALGLAAAITTVASHLMSRPSL